MPTVSVLIPTYNYARYLPEAIESVLAQDLESVEIIISDDCSTDGSAEIIAKYALRDSRIKATIQKQNLGMVANWNWCLAQAKGKYIKYLFGDDCLAHPAALRKYVDLFESDPSISLVSSARMIIDECSEPQKIWNELINNCPYPSGKLIAQCIIRDRNPIGEPSAVLFKRTDALRGFDVGFKQLVDLEMWFHLLQKGLLRHTDEALCCFRVHNEQQTSINRANANGLTEMYQILRRYRPLLHESGHLMLGSLIDRLMLLRIQKSLRRIQPSSSEVKIALKWIQAQLPLTTRFLDHAAYRVEKFNKQIHYNLMRLQNNSTLRNGCSIQRALLSRLRNVTATHFLEGTQHAQIYRARV
jgi:glycosyltransferase involved in cell wall biosynthesis